MYHIQPCCHWMLSLASSRLLPIELYLAPHPLDLPCVSHALLAIQEHLVCGANSCCFGHVQMLSCKLTMIISEPLGCHLLSITFHCRERKSIARLVNFLLTSESVQLQSYSLGEAYLKVSLPGWWALLNYNLTLNCAGSSRCFSSQVCKIESMCLSD
jgi:hypothetical protein